MAAGAEVRHAPRSAAKRGFAARLFGYDVFISFALGPPPRGSQGYASDLARRLRERDLTVFFSEDEAAPGGELDAALKNALNRSKLLVVITNRGTLLEPRWVRTEVEEFRRRHPSRPVIPISVGGALQDPGLGDEVAAWLPFRDRIWLDESADSAANGIASDALIDRLLIAPRRMRSNVAWRWLLWTVIVALLMLAAGLAFATKAARDGQRRAQAELRRATAFRLISQSQAHLASSNSYDDDERSMLEAAAALRLVDPRAPAGEVFDGAWNVLAAKKELAAIVRADGLPASARHPDDEWRLDLAWSPDGMRWLCAEDMALRLRDASTGEPLGPPLVAGAGASPWRNVAISADGSRLAALSTRGELRLWDAKTFAPVPIGSAGPTEGAGIDSFALSPDGRTIAVTRAGRLERLDGATGAVQGGDKGNESMGASLVAWSSDGTMLAVVGGRGSTSGWRSHVQRWDAVAWRPIGQPLPAFDEETVGAVAFSADGGLLLAGGGGRRRDGVREPVSSEIRIWDARSGQPVGEPLKGHTDSVTALKTSPDGAYFASAARDGSVRLWSLRDRKPVGPPLRGQQGVITALGISPDGARIASIATDNTIRVWRARGAQPLRGLPPPRDALWGDPVIFSPGGQVAASLSSAGMLRRWDLREGRVTESALASALVPPARTLAHISDDGKVFGVYGADAGLEWRESDGGRLISKLALSGPMLAIAFSSDGERVATSDGVGRLTLWHARSGEPIWSHPGTWDTAVIALAFDEPARQLVIVRRGGAVERLGVGDGQRRMPGVVLEGAERLRPLDLTYQISPDRRRIVATAASLLETAKSPVRWWDASTGRLLGGAGAMTDGGASLVFSRGGRFALTNAILLGGLQFWDSTTGSRIGAEFAGPAASVEFDPGGRRIVWIDKAGRMHALPSPDAWVDEICAKLSRTISPDEWRERVSPEVDYLDACPGRPRSSGVGTTARPSSGSAPAAAKS